MFKRLKQKIEEGGEAGIDKVSFSPRKFPGAIVRSPPVEAPDFPGMDERESEGGDGGEGDPGGLPPNETSVEVTEATGEGGDIALPNEIPSHLQSILGTDTMLARIEELQQERTALEQQVEGLEKAHSEEKEKQEEDTERRLDQKDQQLQEERRRADKYDEEATELKLQVVELQLERAEVQHELEGEVKSLQERMDSAEQEAAQEKRRLEEQIAALQEVLSEKETLLAKGETHLYEMESTTKSLESRIEAYSSASESDMVLKLQSEMLDLERRLKSRMVDIDLLETRLTVQDRQRETEQQAAIETQMKLEASLKELTEQLSEQKAENHRKLKELEKEQWSVTQKEEELSRLRSQLENSSKKCQHLEWQLDEVRQQDYIGIIRERDVKISELSHTLEHLRTELSKYRSSDGAETEEEEVVGRRDPHEVEGTLSVGVQTLAEDSPAAVLPVTTRPDLLAMDSLGDELEPSAEPNGEPATMRSIGLIEELQALRREQLKYQEEVAEKNKIIRLQQQKIVDMRKALNKELQRTQGSMDINHRSSFSPPRIAIASDVNFQYLKHVVIKFICSREDEATQLVRAIATLLEFNPQEEKHVKDFLEYKMSWFGSMPRPLYPPTART